MVRRATTRKRVSEYKQINRDSHRKKVCVVYHNTVNNMTPGTRLFPLTKAKSASQTITRQPLQAHHFTCDIIPHQIIPRSIHPKTGRVKTRGFARARQIRADIFRLIHILDSFVCLFIHLVRDRLLTYIYDTPSAE